MEFKLYKTTISIYLSLLLNHGFSDTDCTQITAYTQNSDLSQCQRIKGSIGISKSDVITDVDVFNHMLVIEGYLWIMNNSRLSSVTGFSKLSFIGQDLYIKRNGAIKKLRNVFSSLETIGGDLRIEHNDALEELFGFSNLKKIIGNIFLSSNSGLRYIGGFQNLKLIEGMMIEVNNVLHEVDAFPYLKVTLGGIYIGYNNNLKVVQGYASLTTIKGDLEIHHNDAVADVNEFHNLLEIDHNLRIVNNIALTNVDGFTSLRKVGKDLIISNNDAITNLYGFRHVTHVGWDVFIDGNHNLRNLEGLFHVETIGGSLKLYSTAILTVRFPMLCKVGGDMQFRSNRRLEMIKLCCVEEPHGIIIAGSPNITCASTRLHNYGRCTDSHDVCSHPSEQNLSGGSIVVIAFVILTFVYCVGGMLFNVATGRGCKPVHMKFWTSLPGYVKDGLSWSISKVTPSKKEQYAEFDKKTPHQAHNV